MFCGFMILFYDRMGNVVKVVFSCYWGAHLGHLIVTSLYRNVVHVASTRFLKQMHVSYPTWRLCLRLLNRLCSITDSLQSTNQFDDTKTLWSKISF